MYKQVLLLFITTLALGLMIGYFFGYDNGAKEVFAEITSFEECAAAGFPIMESYPEQCRTPDGKHFVREVPEEPETPDTSDDDSPVISPPILEPVACTMDAKICPDGTALGRTGPNCEFPPCP
jgi:hypothetical protein